MPRWDSRESSAGVGSLESGAGSRESEFGEDRVAKVMVVDDAAFMRLRACKVLQDNGHDVVQAENGVEAVRQYAEHRPDAVLMDITMPEMDGLAALKEIKKLDPAARVAMVTAMGQQAIVMEALKAGAKDFVLKPFQPDRVLGALHKLLAA
jgi:two-component system chemotaxis response regulator CheY